MLAAKKLIKNGIFHIASQKKLLTLRPEKSVTFFLISVAIDIT